jgi:hypothetical protein
MAETLNTCVTRLEKAMAELAEAQVRLTNAQAHLAEVQARHDEKFEQKFEQMKQEELERGRVLDERIANLVSAIGEMIRRNEKS